MDDLRAFLLAAGASFAVVSQSAGDDFIYPSTQLPSCESVFFFFAAMRYRVDVSFLG